MTVTFQNHTKVRTCSISDVPALEKVARLTLLETFSSQAASEKLLSYSKNHFSSQQLCKEIQRSSVRFYAVISHAKTVAYMKVNTSVSREEKPVSDGLEIEHLYVLKDFQNKQIGRALVEEAVAYAKALGLKRVWLSVWEKNPTALTFYKKMGFAESKAITCVCEDTKLTKHLLILDV